MILTEKMVLGCNTIKEPFNRNMLQKDQVANYHRKRKHLDACRGRNVVWWRTMSFFYKQRSTDFWRDKNLLEFWGDDEGPWIPPVWTWKTRIVNSLICGWTKVINLRRLCCRSDCTRHSALKCQPPLLHQHGAVLLNGNPSQSTTLSRR